MKKPRCKNCQSPHYTYEPHAINSPDSGKERLTDAINTPTQEGDKLTGVLPVRVVRESVPDAQAPPPLPTGSRTPNRRSREAYNSYMKDYMRAYRRKDG